MTVAERGIYAKITNHVQMVGYREVVEAQGKARGLTRFVFNDVDGSVKVMARGPEPVLTEFIQDLKSDRPDTVIDTIEIIEDIAYRHHLAGLRWMMLENTWHGLTKALEY